VWFLQNLVRLIAQVIYIFDIFTAAFRQTQYRLSRFFGQYRKEIWSLLRCNVNHVTSQRGNRSG
jgi:hypothetical protein